ncbi:MAG: pyruvate dehydrogenase complex E1 component subunit beta [Turneriella sp.]|nr:pyruvate dehydrogenase complex E1 component subunit beta [Turneriella sp.]
MAEVTIREALNIALAEELARDKNVFLIGEEVGHYNGAYKVSQGLMARFGEDRVIDTPIAEAGFAGLAIGAAMAGLRPVVEFMTWNFSLVAIDQLINNAAKMRLMSGGQFSMPIVFRAPQGAGGSLAAQHSSVLEGFYAYTPGLHVLAPATPSDMRGLLKTAIRSDDPVIFLEHEKIYAMKGELAEPDNPDYLIPMGQSRLVENAQPAQLTIICWSMAYYTVLQAVERLNSEGIYADILDLRSLKPVDSESLLLAAQKTHRLLIVQEATPVASYGAWLSHHIQEIAFDELDAPIALVSSDDVPMPYAFSLEPQVLPNVERIVATAKQLVA